MAKQYKVLVNTGKADNNKVLDIQQGVGDRGQPVRIKAQAGAKYELQEAGRKKPVGPDYIKAKRVGKDLHILFEDERQASLIIEDYYEVMPEGYNGVIGQAENGSFYEYIPEDPKVSGLVSELAEGGQAVNVALGGAQVAPVGVALGGFAFSPLMGILGLGAIGAVAAAVDGKGNKTPNTGVAAGKLDSGSDSGVVGDQKTNNASPTLSGTVPTGATAEVTLNGQKYPVTVKPDGTWSFTTPTNLPDGTYYPILHVTENGVTQDTNITPFTIDTTAPTIAISSNAVALAANQTATITFTLSEVSSDFTAADITVTGGSLGSLTQSATDPKVYTALFTPSGSGTSASISVGNGRFSDAAANLNADGAEANNTVSIATNAPITGELSKTSPNDSGVPGDNITNNTKPSLNGKVPAGSTASVTLNGQKYPVTVNPDGAWSFTNPTNLPDGTYTPVLDVTTNGQTNSTPLTPFTVDTTPPTITVTSAASVLAAGQSTSMTFTLSEAANDFAQEDITVTGGTLSNFQKSATDPKVYTATFTPSGTGSSATISVASAKFSDAAANLNADGAEANNTVSLSTNNATSGQLAPASDNSTGTPNDGKTNDKTPELSGKVPAGSTASVTLNGQTYPVTVKPDGTWSFTQPTDLPDGTYTPQLNVITNGQSSTTPITPFTIDTTPPTVAITGGASTLVAGQSTTLTLTLSEASTDLTDADLVVAGGKLGPLQQSASNPLVYTATFTAGSGSNASVSIGSDKFADAVGNLNKDGAETNNSWTTAVTPSTSASAKTALSIDPIAGDNIVNTTEGTGSYNVTGKVTGIYATGDLVEFALNGKTYAATVAADGSFSVPVSMADLKADADTKIEGTITGKDGDTATASQDYQVENSANANTLTALSIDPVTANNLLSDSEVTGSIAITGKVTGKFATGDTVTLTVNGKTFTGSAAATGKFSINVPAADLQADADTQVDGTVTGTGGTTAAALQNYALDSDGPFTSSAGTGAKTALSIDPIAGDNIVTVIEGAATSYTVTGKVTGTYAAGDLVSLTINGRTYTALVATNGSYSVAVAMSDLKADTDTLIEGIVTGTAGDTATASQDYVVETNANAGTQTALKINPVTADNMIGSSENTGNIAITGSVSGKYAAGDTVTLTVNGKTFTGTAAANGSYSIAVPASDLTADSDTQVDGTVTGTGGTTAKALQDYGVDLNPEPVPTGDTTPPTIIVSRTNAGTTLAAGANETITFKLSEASMDFSAADVAVTGGTLSNFTPVPTSGTPGTGYTDYTATFTPTAGSTGTATVGVVAGKFSDNAGNQNLDTFSGASTVVVGQVVESNNQVSLSFNTIPADTTTPVIAISRKGTGVLTVGGSDQITFVLSETSTTFTLADVDVVGGTLTNFTSVLSSGDATRGYTDYTATFTPSANSSGQQLARIGVQSGKFTDAANNANLDTYVSGVSGTSVEANNVIDITYNTQLPDTTAPTVIVSRAAAGMVNTSETIYFTLSEASANFALSDVDVTGGTLSNFAPVASMGNSISGYTQYTATFTPTANASGTATVGVKSGVFSDAAGNQNPDTYVSPAPTGASTETNNQVVLSFNTVVPDTTAPTIAVSRQGTGVVTGNETITFTLSEPSANLVAADVDVVGGTLTNFAPDTTTGNASTGYTSYTATFVPNANSVVSASVAVASSKFTDAASNNNLDTYLTGVSGATQEANNIVNFQVNTDTTAPTIIVGRQGSGTVTGPITVTFTLSESSTDFSLLDVDAVGGTLSNLQGSGTSYSATFTPAANAVGTASVGVASSKFSDVAGNFNQDDFNLSGAENANNRVSIAFNTVSGDTTPPTILVERTNPASSLDAVGTETILFKLSEASTTFDASDIAVTGGTLGNFTPVASSGTAAGGYTQYTAVFTPTAGANGTATIGVASAKFADMAGNLNQDTYLSPAPTGAVTELATGNTNLVSVVYDTRSTNPADNDKPTVLVSIDKATLSSGQTATLTFILSESSTNFALADIDVISGGGTVSNLLPVAGSNGVQYTATYTAGSTAGTVLIGVDSAKFTDATGNANADTYKGSAAGTTAVANTTAETNNWVSLTNTGASDTTAPTVLVTRSGTGTVGASGETIVFTLSEASTDFVVGDVAATGGALSNWVQISPTQYSATFVPTAGSSGAATIGVLAGKFADAASNLNKDTFTNPATGTDVFEANNQVVLSYDARTNPAPADTTAPTIAITADKTTLAAGQTASITFTLSEASSDFTNADIVVTGGTLSNITGSGTSYTATFTPTSGSQGTGSIRVDSNTFRDAASNYNQDGADANNTVNFITNNGVAPADTTAPTIAIVSNQASLSSGQTALITFTLSETSSDFVWDGTTGDIVVTGGTLSALAAVAGSNGTQYSATFTPAANSTVAATIGVKAGKFTDAAENSNKDTYDSADTFPGKVVEANNQVSINVNTTGASTLNLVNDTATAIEAGVAVNAGTMSTVAGTNPSTNTQAAGVLGNDTSATSVTAIAFGSNTGTVGNALAGQYGSLTLSSNGTYSYTLNNSNATVNALPAGGTLSEVFTYTATDGTTSKTANLTITITGTNDAPVAVADTATATEAGGAANAAAGTDPTGNVLTNDTDVDTADTKTVSAILAGTTGTASNVTAASAAADTTGIAGSFGTLKIGTDGSYSYAVNQTNASVQALLPTSTALTDTFTYTVKDAAGATHTNTLTVSVKGANDAPEVQVALVNQSATPDSLLTYPFAGNTGTASDTFKDVDTGHQTGLTYTATLADGSSLPSWLSFNASTRTFSGTPPESAASTTVAVKVTATDALNASTSSNFNIAIGAVPVASVKTALSIDPIATDNVITSTENTGNIAVTGKVTGTFASGDTVTLSINGKTFTGAAAANGTYSINVPASDLAADSDTKIEGSVTGGNGGTLATAAQDYTVEASTTLTKTALSINPVTPDNLISNSEPDSNGDIAVTGKVTGKFATGDVVTLSVNGVRYSGTAAADGTYSINVKATDLALDADTTIDGTVSGTGGTLASALQNYGLDTRDTTAPKIAISSNQASLTTGQTATITFTLSEPSADFDATDIETSGGTLGTLTHVGVNSSGQDVYTATFTPTPNSTANGVVKVASDKFRDAAANFNKDTYASGVAGTTQETDNTVTLTVNTTSGNTTPAGVKTALSIDPVTGDNVVISTDTANVTITGKASGTFAAGDTVTLTVNNTAYTAQVAADGSYSISVTASDLTTDSDTKIEGTITGTGGDTATSAQDYTVESSSTLTKTALNIDRVTADNVVLSSEADSNGNIAVTGRVTGKFASGDTVSLVVNGVTSTGTVNSQGVYSINVKATDLLADSDTNIDGSVSGTGGTTATALQNYALTDLASPTVAISRSGTGAMTAAETITFTLSEASTTFASTDVDISGGALTNWATTDNITFTATFTPTSGFFGSGAIGVKAGTFTDASGNANKDTYEAFVTGTILEENNLLDLSINTDTTPPTVIVSRSTSTTVTGAETITFTLSDNAGTSFDASDIFVTPGAGTLSNFVGDGTVYTATFTPTANSAGSTTIGVMAGKFSDPAGNLNKDTFDSADTVSGKVVETNNAVTFNYKTDNTTPTIAITGPAGAVSGPATITFTLSEVSSDFEWDPSNPNASTNDIVVTGGGTLSALTPSTTTPGVFTATYTPPSGSGTGTATISVASNKFSDAAGNFNTDGGDTNNSLSVNFDTVTPTVTVSRATTATLGSTGSTASTETITFTLSEASSDFTSSDVVVSAGALSNWTAVSSTVYTATYTPPTGANAATGTATIGVRAGKFQDAAGNQNADDFTLTGGPNSNAENNNNVVSVAYDTVVPTQTVSFSSMTKDSGLSTGNANWTTADASAGRLVSGFVSAPLAAGEAVQIWVKKDSGAAALLGTATVDAGGTTWAYTDTTNYVGATGATGNTAGWTYSAKVVDAAGNAAPTATQVVNGETTAASTPSAPTIDSVGTDATFASTISHNGSTGDNTLAVKGRATAGNLVTLFDNTSGNVVKGGIVVDSNGDWTADLTGTALGNGTHNFYAVQTNAQGTSSVLSNQHTVNVLVNMVSNGNFESGNAIQQATGSAVTGWTVTAGNVDILQVTGTKVLDTAGASPGTISQTISGLVIGQTYAWSFTNAREDEVPDQVEFELSGATTSSQTLSPASNAPAAVNGTFVAQSTTVTMTFADTLNNGAADRGILIDNVVLSRVDSVPAPNGSLSAGGTLTTAATAQADVLTYSGSPLIALAGNDTITATSSNLQSTLAAGGFIDGGAGIDTLKLVAGTTLNLQTLTGNQTVQKIQEVEILQMQGSSSLTLNANNVLSLGGSNASTMTPFSFSSTQQVADGGVAATGSTSSTGKVQMVIQGGTGDALKLDALATDGVSSTAGVLGNSGLTGSWAYKGQVQIGTISYKVYDHSTTQAQVLVDVPVVVTTASPIAITAISSDSGTSSTDFITNDTTLVYSGTVPVEYNDGNHDVFVEILNSSGTVVQSGTASVNNGSWSLDKTASALSAGNYTIRSTIVNQGTTTTTSSFGSQGVDTQPLVIDTTAPTIIVARANNSTATLSIGQTETINFTLSEASTNFDVSDVTVTGGTLSNFGGSGTSYSATFTPTASTSGTGSISVANSKFSDAAGNQNADGAESNNSVSVTYVTAVPTQTVTFSSMTKDSSLALDNADWTTGDGSAGRLVSGTLDAVLITGQVLKVYSNGTYIGDAVVNGKAWEITDTTGYTADWTYTAKVEDAAGNVGPTTTRIVTTDFNEAAPVIDGVVDSASAIITSGGSTANTLSSVTGKGVVGNTIYLYDNTGTNLVGTTTVATGGTWSISGLATNDAVGGGANTFSARQMDSLGNVSVLSNAWTVTASSANLLTNGNFASGFTGFSSGLTSTGTTYSYTSTAGGFAVGPLSGAGAMNPVNTATTANYGPTAYTFGTWSKKTIASYVNPNGAFSGDALYGEVQQSTVATILSQNVKVTAGKTYTFKFDYATTAFDLQGLRAIIDGASIDVTTKNNGQESGQFSVTYVATSDKTINLSLTGGHTQDGNGDFVIDNVSFAPTPPSADGSLVQNGTLPGTAGIDGVVGTNNGAVLTYKGGAIDLIGGNDVLNANTNIQTLLSSSSNLINGGAGVDTLKLAAGTVLDLEALTNNQTVKTLEQVEIVQMQGSSTLTMSANNVLSLGGAHASTMNAYNFSSTNQVADGATAATGSTNSTGKVQFVVNGTASDTLVLNTLQTDDISTNGTIGNTGLAGQWDYKGTVQITGVDGILHTYAVYNQSTTQAQVLVDLAVNVMTENPALVTNVATFSSMTKDSGQAATVGVNADWTTNDASAGRLVSGTLASTLASGDVVKVYANGVLINGNATVNSAGTAWEITDTTGYTGSWAYTAQVVNSAGQGGAVTVQQVNLDVTAVTPVITSVTDSTGVRINNEGSTANKLGTVSGTGVAGETIHLYDNTGTNLVGSTIVTNDGTWSISGLATNAAVGYGNNTFSARQVDAVGNTSAQSNLWTVLSTNGNTFTNGYFDGGSANGFANELVSGPPSGANNSYQITTTGTGQTTSGTTNLVSGPTAYAFGTWSTKYLVGLTNPDGTMKDYTLNGQVSSSTVKTIWQQIAPVVAGKTYLFTFDYIQRDFVNQDMAVWIDGAKIQFVANAAGQDQSGHFTATYVATWTGNITVSLDAANDGTGNLGDYTLDNFAFGPIAAPLPDGSLVAGGTPPGTAGVDGVVGVNNGSVLNYKGGSIDLIGGNDVLNAGANLQSLLTNTNNLINGGAGADILKLSAGTVLNLGALTANQTVKPISQMEIFQLQGNSVLTMTANDVLSLGGANTASTSSGNTSTMSAYSFASTNQSTNDGALTPTGQTSSTGKVQFVVNGTNTDVLVLDTLKLDGVTTNAIVGNTGLAGQWDYKGTVSITGVDGVSHTYAVYDQSTTKAQVLVDLAVDVKLPTNASPTNAGVGLAVSISTDANNDGLVNSAELSTATNLTSRITVNSSAVVGDVVVVTATNGATALTPVSKTLTATDITNGFDVTFAKPDSGVKQVVSANYVSATSGPAADASPTDSAEFIAAAPKVTVTMADKALSINETSLVTFQFSENVTGFTAADVSYSGGTLSALTKVNDSKWTATFTPTQNTNTVGNIISVAANSYTNTAGVNGSEGQDTYSVDTRLASAVAGRGIGVSGSESFNNVTTAITFGVSFPVLNGAIVRFQKNGVTVREHTVNNSDNINYRETSGFNGDWGATITYQGQTVNLPRMQRVSFNNNIAGFSQFTSPLVMDLNGDGVQTMNMTDGVMFDLQASGQKSAVGWVSSDDGLLVMDLNGDGKIASGSELFGNHKLLSDGTKAADGWQALAELDSNGDGQITATDADFAKLLVWVDANSDGVSDAGELRSLAELGIVSIDLGADQTRVAQNGNYLQGFSSYTRSDGTSHEIVDAWLEEASTQVAETNLGIRDITGELQSDGQTSANVLKLNLTDVLAVHANASGQHQVTVHGDANDTVNLSNLLDTGEAQGSWQASGVVVQTGVTYNAYSHSADASLQVLIDQNITQVNMG